MPEVIVCKIASKVIQDLAKRVNGGLVPAAITLADTTFYLEGTPSEAMRRHEEMHQKQWKRFRPWWMPMNPWRDRIAFARFIAAYIAEHKAHSYRGNKFELEAQAAETA